MGPIVQTVQLVQTVPSVSCCVISGGNYYVAEVVHCCYCGSRKHRHIAGPTGARPVLGEVTSTCHRGIYRLVRAP